MKALLGACALVVIAAPSTFAQTAPVVPAPTPKQVILNSAAAYAALSSYSSTGQTVSGLSGMSQTTTFTIRLQRPNLYRIDWKSGFSSGAVYSDGTGDFLQMSGAPQKQPSREMALGAATGISGMAAATIPGTFYKQNWGGALNANLPWDSKPDENIGALPCYVVTNQTKPASGGAMTTTLWIGQQDNLIHRSRTVMDKVVPPKIKLTDAQITQGLKLTNQPVTPEAIARLRKVEEDGMSAAQGILQSGPITFTQDQENIATNKTFTAADFSHP